MFTVDEKTWIISDTHLGHDNIVRYCNRPRNHNKLIIVNWKKSIKKTDIVLHLGDVTVWYGSQFFWAKQVGKLPGHKFLIRGNHDDQWTDDQWFSKCGMTVIPPFLQNKLYFSHEPVVEGDWQINVHGHTHNHTPFKYYWRFGSEYYNASIEGMDYKPVRMRQILKDITS
jgi:calcineurin-like phosphoesterase family protein